MTRPMTPARRRFLQFLASIAVLHIAAIAVYYGLDVASAPAGRQRIYAWTWMGLTIAVILVGLQRIKRVRRLGR